MSTRIERLATYLSAAARRPFDWREFHCGVLVADWVLVETGVDPMGELRACRTAAEAALAILWAGGFVPLLRHLAAEAGLSETVSPEPGDIGIIAVRASGGIVVEAAAIRGETRWAAISPRGLISWRAAPVVAWRV